MQWLELIPQWVQVLAFFAAFVGGVVAVTRRFYKTTSGIVDGVKYLNEEVRPALAAFKQHVEQDVGPTLKALKAQLMPNGGSSLHDRIKRIDERVLIMEARQKLLDTNSAVGEFQTDEFGLCMYANSTLCDMYGLTESQMIGNGWLRAVVAEERQSVYDKWMGAVRNDFPYECRYRVRCCAEGGGETFEVQATAVAIRDSSGKIIRFYGSVEKYHPGSSTAVLDGKIATAAIKG